MSLSFWQLNIHVMAYGSPSIAATMSLTPTETGNGYSRNIQKPGKKRQNQTQSGKDRKRQSQSKPEVKSQSPWSTKVNSEKSKSTPTKPKQKNE
nr:hypothetical protein [Tanacetum cinerariifolium]